MLAEGSASIEVSLPANAKVFVNDAATTSTGSTRSYVSKGLKSGQTYAYRFRVEFEHDVENVVENKTVKLKAGDKVAMSIVSSDVAPELADAAGETKTELKVAVPADAKVYLSGNLTKQTGTERTYTTHRLKPGEQWSNYVVRVELEIDGKPVVQEQSLEIEGGESYELAFDFEGQDSLQIAQISK